MNAIKRTNAASIVCACEVEEFFYADTDKAVPEGDPIGFDVENGAEVELVLFSNIYWNPQY